MQQSGTRWKRNRKFFSLKEEKKSQTLQSLMKNRLTKFVFVVMKCAFRDDAVELIFLLKWRRSPSPCLQPMVICSLFFFFQMGRKKRKRKREDVLKVSPFHLWQRDDTAC